MKSISLRYQISDSSKPQTLLSQIFYFIQSDVMLYSHVH